MLRALRSLLTHRAPSGSLRTRSPEPWSRTRARLCSLTGELEARLQRLGFTEDDGGSQETGRGAARSRGADVQELETDFSVQSLASMVNEDCFYESVRQTHVHRNKDSP